MRTLSSRPGTLSMGTRSTKPDLLLRGRKRPVDHPANIQLAFHRVLLDQPVVRHGGLLALRVDVERETNGIALHGAGQVGAAELADVLAGQLFAILLEGDGRRSAAL